MRTMLVLLLLANTLLAQPPASPDELNLGQAIGVGAVKHVRALEDRITELESRSILDQIEAVTTDEFGFQGESLLSHFVEEHQGARLLKKLHEYIHQQIEKLRPAGAYSYIVVEATEQEFVSWMSGYGAEVSKSGWAVVRQSKRPGSKVANIIAIGKTQYSHVGFLTHEALQRIVDSARLRVQQRQAKWKISRIVMHTQSNCPPCERWKRENLAAVRADGVEFVEAGPDGRSTPSFDIELCSDDQCRLVRVGNMRYETMKNL